MIDFSFQRSCWAAVAGFALYLGCTASDFAAVPPPQPDLVPVVDGAWWQIAAEDYDAGSWSNKPAPGEPAQHAHQEVSDFILFQAADGTWQLISAVRQTKFPGNHHLLYRWESPSLTSPHWEEKGIFTNRPLLLPISEVGGELASPRGTTSVPPAQCISKGRLVSAGTMQSK